MKYVFKGQVVKRIGDKKSFGDHVNWERRCVTQIQFINFLLWFNYTSV
jgi:hypothetical protein